MKAGFAWADITPAVGMEKPGGYGKAYIQAIDAPLKVCAAVFDDGRRRVAVVGVDTLVIRSSRDVCMIRREIADTCGIPGDSVLIAASHTHTGGPFFGFLPDEVSDASEPVRTLILEHSTVADPLYAAHVKRQIISSVREADRRKEEVSIAAGIAQEPSVSFNRRFRMKDGRTVTHPGKGNPCIAGPAGPVDPDIVALGAWRKDGTLAGGIINFACHGTVHTGGASPDWIGVMRDTVQRALDTDAAIVFLNGACGDVTQVDNLSSRQPEFGPRWERRVGMRVGAGAVKILAGAAASSEYSVGAAVESMRVCRRHPSEERLERALEVVEQGLARRRKGISRGESTTEWTFAKEAVILDWLAEKEPFADVEVQAVGIGPLVIPANPAELFCTLGLAIKQQSPFPVTAVAELANGSVGYVPDAEAFSPSGGGYETVMTSYSNLAANAGAAIVEASVRCIKRLVPGALPGEPQVEGPVAAWEYGLLGPDPE